MMVPGLNAGAMVPSPAERIGAGRVVLDGEDLVGLPERRLEQLRGSRMAMIFQDPMTSLNPVMTIGAQVAEPLRIHRGMSWTEANRAALRSGSTTSTSMERSMPARRPISETAITDILMLAAWESG